MTILDLSTPEGWKAELTSVVGYVRRWFTCPQTVTYHSHSQDPLVEGAVNVWGGASPHHQGRGQGKGR